jgi:hypothetical protein
MEERAGHLTVVIGASSIADELRRTLVQHDVAHAGVTTHIRGLRRSVVLGENDLVVVCIALDAHTLARHGNAVRQLLADHRCSPKPVRSVGLLSDIGLNRDAAELGCDVYVDDSSAAAKAISQLTRRWQKSRTRTKLTKRQSEARVQMRDISAFASWTWGTDQIPSELAPLLAGSLHPKNRCSADTASPAPEQVEKIRKSDSSQPGSRASD